MSDRPTCPCGSTFGVRRYLTGLACPFHTPAQLAGRADPPSPVPQPEESPRRLPRSALTGDAGYGAATTDPRPRILPEPRFGIARHACDICVRNRPDLPLAQQQARGHDLKKSDHYEPLGATR